MSMEPYEGSLSSLADTPFGYTLSMIGGKWRLVIMYWLVECETMRFNELKRKIGRITDKTLSRQLKDLEADGLVVRTEYPQIPPKVEYRLTEKGKSLYPLMEAMCEWGLEHGADAQDALGGHAGDTGSAGVLNGTTLFAYNGKLDF